MPDPIYDPSTAVAVSPWRHAPTGRTVAWHQAAASEGFTDLFSATLRYIATATNEQAQANDVPAPVPVASLPASEAIFRPIFDGLTGGPGTLSTLPASAADIGSIVQGLVDGERRSYRVAAGADAQVLPGIVRPANFDVATNAVLFVAA